MIEILEPLKEKLGLKATLLIVGLQLAVCAVSLSFSLGGTSRAMQDKVDRNTSRIESIETDSKEDHQTIAETKTKLDSFQRDTERRLDRIENKIDQLKR